MSAGIALDVRSMLQRPMSELRGFTDGAGLTLTPRQARDALQDLLAGGNELLPLGSKPHFNFLTRI
jgi:hypothetical protein